MTTFDDDANVYGQDLIDATRRWVQPVVAQHTQHIQNQLQRTQTELARERVMGALDRDDQLGDKWRAINEDSVFLRWLNEVDPLNGERRMVLLRRAFDLGASDRVVAIFKSYLAQQLPAPQRTGQRLPFEADARRHTAPTPDVRGRRMWRRRDIAAFFEAKRRGTYTGREAEALRIEQDIMAAPRENRIVDPEPSHSK